MSSAPRDGEYGAGQQPTGAQYGRGLRPRDVPCADATRPLAGLHSQLHTFGFYADLAEAQLMWAIAGEPVLDTLVTRDMSVSEETGVHLEIDAFVLTKTHLVAWRATEVSREVANRDSVDVQGAPRDEQPVMSSHTRVLPLAAVIDVRTSMSVRDPAHRAPGDWMPDTVRVDVLTAELGDLAMTAHPCPDDDCGSSEMLGQFAHESVTLLEDAREESYASVAALMRFAQSVTRQIAHRP